MDSMSRDATEPDLGSLAHADGTFAMLAIDQREIEGIAFGVRHILEAFVGADIPAEELRAAGGGTRSPIGIQIVSDVTRRDQTLPTEGIGASSGAAHLAARAIGMIPADDEGDAWFRPASRIRVGPARPVESGAIIEPLHTVLNGQDEARIEPGSSVLVLGLGPIRILHVALARSHGGTRVLGVDPEPGRRDLASAVLGDDVVAQMDAGWDRAKGLLNGEGFDVAVVATGAPGAIASAIALTEPGGRILAFAALPPESSVVAIDVNVLHYRQLSIVGAFGGTPDHFQRAAAWLDQSAFDVSTYTRQRFPLAEAAEAFAAVGRGEGLKTLRLAG